MLNKYFSFLLTILVSFLFTTGNVKAQSTGYLTDVVTTGFTIPAGVSDGVIVKTIFKNVQKYNLQDRYLLLNNDPFIPGSMVVGDILKITNVTSGETFTFDSNCLSKKLPAMDLTYLIDPNGYNTFDQQVLKFEFINKCQTTKNVGELYIYYKHISDIFPFPSPYTDFKQTDPQWGAEYINNSDSCGTLHGYGCAITSVADVFHSYGKTALANTSILLNPGTLNNWLSNHRGFASCGIIWANASPASGLGAPTINFRNGSNDWVTGRQVIDNALANGDLPILGITTNTNSAGTHFLVVSERLPDVNGKPDYKLVDPALYPFVQNALGNTGKSLSQVYGGFDRVFEVVIYKKVSKPQKSLTIRAHSPVQLLISDPFGKQTGYDGNTQVFKENIPESSYGVEKGIAPIDSSFPAQEETKYFQQINPDEGQYTVNLVGTGDGEYTLDFSKTDEQGNVSVQEVHGLAQTGITEIFQIQNTPDATTPIIIDKDVNFQKIKNLIIEFETNGSIKQKSVANSLIRNLEQAEGSSLVGDTDKVIQNLDQFINILERENGRKVSEKAFFILIDNINFLKRKYSV